MMMRKTGIAAFAVAFLTVAAAAAQTTTTVTIAPADAATFKTWATAQKPTMVAAPSGFTVQVGAVVPMNVMLVPIPASANVASLTKYDYVDLGGKLVLVDPMTRKIVYVAS